MSSNRPGANPEDEQTGFSPHEEEYPVDRLKARMNDSLGGRPLTVYLVLFAGAATLLLLLGVVWISATGGGDTDEPICTEISPADARASVLSGQVERINILVDKDRPTESLTGIQLRFTDDSCRQTPQGADIRDELFSIIGAVDLYNEYQDNSIRVHYQSQDIQSELLATSTATVAPTESPTMAPEVPTSTEVPPTEVPTETSTSLPPDTPTETSTQSASISTSTAESDGDIPAGDTGA